MSNELAPDNIELRIEQSFDALSPELQRAARWVLQHGASLALHSMRSSARQAGVTPATMTRLAQRLGFEGFEGLRQPLAQRLVEGRGAGRMAWPHAGRPAGKARGAADEGGQPESALLSLARSQTDHIAAIATLNPLTAFDAAADAMLGARCAGILGLRMSHGIAFQLHYGYGLLAGNGLLLSDAAGTLLDQIAQLGKNDLLVAISQAPYARATVDAVQQALRQHVEVLALTDSALSPIARDATLRLLFASSANAYLHSSTGVLALTEALLDTVTRRGGSAASERLAQRQRQLASARAYWEMPAGGAPARASRDAASRSLREAGNTTSALPALPALP